MNEDKLGLAMAKARPILLTDALRVKFAEEYLVDLNPGAAAQRCGIPISRASLIGHRWARDRAVVEYMRDKQRKLRAKHGITLDMVVRELAMIGFSNMMDYIQVTPNGTPVVDFTSLTREQAAAIKTIEYEEVLEPTYRKNEDGDHIFNTVRKVKFHLHDKRAALVDLGRHLGMQSGAMPEEDGNKKVFQITMRMPGVANGEDRSYREGYGEVTEVTDFEEMTADEQGKPDPGR